MAPGRFMPGFFAAAWARMPAESTRSQARVGTLLRILAWAALVLYGALVVWTGRTAFLVARHGGIAFGPAAAGIGGGVVVVAVASLAVLTTLGLGGCICWWCGWTLWHWTLGDKQGDTNSMWLP